MSLHSGQLYKCLRATTTKHFTHQYLLYVIREMYHGTIFQKEAVKFNLPNMILRLIDMASDIKRDVQEQTRLCFTELSGVIDNVDIGGLRGHALVYISRTNMILIKDTNYHIVP